MNHRSIYKAKAKSIKLLQENRREDLHNLWVGKDLLKPKKALTIKEKSDKLYLKIQNACTSKNIKKIKRKDQKQMKLLLKGIWKKPVAGIFF